MRIQAAHFCRTAAFGLLFTTIFAFAGWAQGDENASLRARAAVLISQGNYIDARAPLEKLAAANPNDAQVQIWLGFALLASADTALTPEDARQLRVRARNAFSAARTAGDKSMLVAGMIDGIPPDGGEDPQFSLNPRANEAMKKAETAYSMGNMDEALSYYQEALEFDPTNYMATLYCGDAYLAKNDLSNAEIWFQKAIALNPYRETAWRYSATPRMRQKKYDEARVRYIEAWITAPYEKLSVSGIMQWAQATGANLGHPRIDRPKVTFGDDGKLNVSINFDLTAGPSQLAWSEYGKTMKEWRDGKFFKEYPGETQYRRSLKGEAAALRAVLSTAKIIVKKKGKKKAKKMAPQIQTIEDLDRAGLLEAYIIMTAPDAGIARDHPKYLREHRDKLREYVEKFVIHKGN